VGTLFPPDLATFAEAVFDTFLPKFEGLKPVFAQLRLGMRKSACVE
jgi:hypothetical protein